MADLLPDDRVPPPPPPEEAVAAAPEGGTGERPRVDIDAGERDRVDSLPDAEAEVAGAADSRDPGVLFLRPRVRIEPMDESRAASPTSSSVSLLAIVLVLRRSGRGGLLALALQVVALWLW